MKHWEDYALYTVKQATVNLEQWQESLSAKDDQEAIQKARSIHNRITEYVEEGVDQGRLRLIVGWHDLGGLAIGRLDVPDPVAHVTSTLVSKQRDYGPENIARFGRMGLLIRTHDKIARLENLLNANREPNNEAIVDTWLDIVGYSAIGVMWERDQFLTPLSS